MVEQITFSSRAHIVRGWVHFPKHLGKPPVIIMCHGFTGNCSEHGLFEKFAKQAADAGFCAVRIDCVGSGASDGSFIEDTYLSGWRDDLLAAIDFVVKQYDVDASRIAVLGISMGAAAALLTLPTGRVNAAAGWAPVLYPAETFPQILNADNWKKLKSGVSVHHVYGEAAFDVAPQFAQDAEQLSVEHAVRASHLPVLLRFGAADAVINPGFADRIAAFMLPHVSIQIVPGEAHSFLVHEQWNIDETIAFFQKKLMLGEVIG